MGETRGRLPTAGFTTLEVDSVVASPTTAGLLYAGTERGVFRSSDGGDSWRQTGLDGSVRSLLIDPSNDGSIYAGTERGLFWSVDRVSTWQRMDSVPAGTVTSLAMDSRGRMLYAAVNDVGIFRGVKE